MDFSLMHPSLFRTHRELDEIPPVDHLNLAPVYHQFVLPGLGKPQDPILANLLSRAPIIAPPNISNGHKPSIHVTCPEQETNEEEEPIPIQSCALSWDQIRHDYATRIAKWEPPSFLSEQPLKIYSALQEHTHQRAGSLKAKISSTMFCDFLRTLLNGESSHLAAWDKDTEMFRTLEHARTMTVDRLGMQTTSSLIERFTLIGTLLRRLEWFVTTERSSISSPGMHSLTHCIHVILSYLSFKISSRVLGGRFVEDWIQFEVDQQILESLANLCFRGIGRTPSYESLPQEPHALLSHIYEHLSFHINSSAPPRLQAIFAYILSNVASHWLEDLGRRIGLVPPAGGGQLLAWQSPFAQDADCTDSSGTGTSIPEPGRLPELPSFIHKREATYVSRGAKSLKILREARPHHPMCRPSASTEIGQSSGRVILQGWVWTEAELEEAMVGIESHIRRVKRRIALWKQGIEPLTNFQVIDSPPKPTLVEPESIQELEPGVHIRYKPELAGIRRFDLEPGTGSTISHCKDASTKALDQFIQGFPETLPLVASTLEHLTQITVTDPLVAHCRLLSSSLLELFVVDLRLLAHLDLMHRFFLFGDPGFVRRLRVALFKAEEEDSSPEAGCPVALNPKLSSVKDEWPPVGYGLSFSLRSVVVEALDLDDDAASAGEEEIERRIREEADWRIGFIIKDGEQEGEDTQRRWADRAGLEALGFLTLQYRPPPPLDVLIDPDVVSKYQRIFDFLLCLLRAETASLSLYQSFTASSACQTGRRQLRHKFCFEVHHFVTSLTTYVFDSAIASHWKPFLNRMRAIHRRLAPVVAKNNKAYDNTEWTTDEFADGFDDVFSISSQHSDALDKILTACLLKSRHRAAGAAVKKPLQLILDLADVLTEAMSPDGSIIDAAEIRLVELYGAWDASMRHLVKVLRAMDERGPSQHVMATQSTDDDLRGARAISSLGSNRELGAGDLLLRLDPSGWYWKSKK
ncbi:hypothetical protein FRB94_006929 [Tulasnella sp. JGI-2019a]|nr:hypothetical protein FRB94_006929 [Tulasnella sp. JGI-2019a]